MFEPSRASRMMDALFGPIENRARADDLARLLGVVVLVLAVVEAAFVLFFGPAAIAVAAAEATLGGLVWWRKNMIAAVALLAVALAATVSVLHGVLIGEGSAAAWALVVSFVGVWAGGRAVHCTVAFRRLPT